MRLARLQSLLSRLYSSSGSLAELFSAGLLNINVPWALAWALCSSCLLAESYRILWQLATTCILVANTVSLHSWSCCDTTPMTVLLPAKHLYPCVPQTCLTHDILFASVLSLTSDYHHHHPLTFEIPGCLLFLHPQPVKVQFSSSQWPLSVSVLLFYLWTLSSI